MFLALTLGGNRNLNIPNHLLILYFSSANEKFPEQGCEVTLLNGATFRVRETENEIINLIGDTPNALATKKQAA